MAIDKNFLNELRLRLPLSAIIGQRIKITRAGREYKACCPFHEEKSPSFYVNDDKGFYHCFGCGAHGDIVGFRMRYDNTSFREAVEALARDAGLPIPDYAPVDHAKYDHNRTLQKVMELATLWFESQLRLPANKFALDYLTNRGLTSETMAGFRIGFAPNNWDAMREAMVKQDIPLDQLVETGLLKSSDKNDRPPYSFFRGRIMFPVADRQGMTIAFGGRHLDAAFNPSDFTSGSDFKPAKYINSVEYSLFNKGSQLYSLSRARGSLKNQPLLIVEGFMDVIALHQAGFKTAVAPLGTALTEQQIQLAWQVSGADANGSSRPPTLCFDGDSAGLNAAYRALDRMLPFLTADRQAQFAFLPQGEDPDSLVKANGAKAFQTILDQAKTVFDVLWQRAINAHGTSTPEAQAKIQTDINESIGLMTDKALQGAYGSEMWNRLKQLRKPAFVPFAKGYSRTAPVHHPVAMTSPKQVGKDNLQTQILFATIINHPFLLTDHRGDFAQVPMPDGDHENTFHDLQHAILEWEPNTASATPNQNDTDPRENLLEYLSNQGFDPIVNHLLTERIYKHARFARLTAEPTDVLEGWHNVWNAIQKDRVQLDVTEMKRLAKDSLTHAERLWELKRQELQGEDDPY